MRREGYISLLMVLVVGGGLVLSLAGAAMRAATGAVNSSGIKDSWQGQNMAEACVEEILWKIKNNLTIPNSVTIEGKNCTVSNLANSGNLWSFSVQTNNNGWVKKFDINLERNGMINLLNWNEVK